MQELQGGAELAAGEELVTSRQLCVHPYFVFRLLCWSPFIAERLQELCCALLTLMHFSFTPDRTIEAMWLSLVVLVPASTRPCHFYPLPLWPGWLPWLLPWH